MMVDLRMAALGLGVSCLLWACGQTTSSGGEQDGDESGGNASGNGGSLSKETGGASGDSGGTTGNSGGSGPGSGGAPAEADGGTGNETGGADGTGGSRDPGADAAWFYFETGGDGFVLNVQSPRPAVEIPGGLVVNTAQSPWSENGREAAFLLDNEIVFYELGEEAKLKARLPSLGYQLIHGYLEGVGAVVTGGLDSLSFVAVVRPDGDEIRLDERSASLAGLQVGVPPRNDTVVWTETGAEFKLSFASFENGEVSASETLSTFSASPPLSEAWSPDGNWYSFGISGGEGNTESGIYLWRVGSETLVPVSPEGASYAPFFPFSPDSSQIAVWLTDGNEATLTSYDLQGDEAPSPSPIRTGATLSPAVWTPFGSLLFEEEQEGIFQPVSAAGAGEALPFDGFVYGCELFWISETKFFHSGCGKSPAFVVGTITDGQIEEEAILLEATENYGLSPNRACYVQWNAQSLLVGPTTGDLDSVESLAPGLEGVAHVFFTPDSSSVVWVQEGGIYRAELEDCFPKGEPVRVHELAGEVTRAVFITPAL